MGAAASGARNRFSLYHFSSIEHVTNHVKDRSVSGSLMRTDEVKVG